MCGDRYLYFPNIVNLILKCVSEKPNDLVQHCFRALILSKT